MCYVQHFGSTIVLSLNVLLYKIGIDYSCRVSAEWTWTLPRDIANCTAQHGTAAQK